MAMSVGPSEAGEEEAPMSDINTTPLVDVMLVLLIIFLITVPVVIQTIPMHIRGDVDTPYKCIGGAIFAMQMAGFARVGFISEPPPGGVTTRL